MQINKDYEPELNLRSIFFSVLYHWRSMLLIAIICAAAFGAYEYYDNVIKSHVYHERDYDIKQQNYKEEMEIQKIKLDTSERAFAGALEHREKSIVYDFDPEKTWVKSKTFMVIVDKEVIDALPAGNVIDPADNILAAYSLAMNGMHDETELTEIFGTNEMKYVQELAGIMTNSYENTITIWARGASEEDAQKERDYIEAKIKETETGKAQTVNAHTLLEINDSTVYGYDSGTMELQKTIDDQVENYKAAVQTARITMFYYEFNGPQKYKANIANKTVLGFVFGFFLTAAFFLVIYAANGKLKDGKAVSEQYNIPVLGEVYTGPHQKNFLSKAFERWETKRFRAEAETVYANINALIHEYKGIEKILFVSSLPEDKISNIREQLSASLKDKEMEFLADFLNHSEMIQRTNQADAVVLIEGKDLSRTHSIKRMAEELSISSANVIGAIIQY